MSRVWQPIGDPTPIGWTITIAYLVAALVAYAASRGEMRTGGQGAGAAARYWRGLAWGLLALGLNKQLDLQILAAMLGRKAFEVLQWGALRRGAQALFALVFGAFGLAFAFWFLRSSWTYSWRHKLSAFGVLYLLIFVVVRVAAFQHLGRLLGVFQEPWLLSGLELLGILLILLPALSTLLPRALKEH